MVRATSETDGPKCDHPVREQTQFTLLVTVELKLYAGADASDYGGRLQADLLPRLRTAAHSATCDAIIEIGAESLESWAVRTTLPQQQTDGPKCDHPVAELTARLEARMLSGEPFSCSELVYSRSIKGTAPYDLDFHRLVDRTIQKLRKKRLISFTRQNGTPIWKAMKYEVSK